MVKPKTPEKQIDQERNDIRFKGVRKRKWGKWVSEIRLPNSRERIWLGSYDTPEKAAKAFDAALYCLRGKGAKFNFPENPPEIIGGRSLKPQEIQVAAARFAHQDSSPSSLSMEEEQIGLNNLRLETPLECQSPPSVSIDNDLTIDWQFLDNLVMTGSESSRSDFGTFGGLEDFAEEFFAPQIEDDQEEQIDGGDFSQTSFLWNF